jgi:hypothetical protein
MQVSLVSQASHLDRSSGPSKQETERATQAWEVGAFQITWAPERWSQSLNHYDYVAHPSHWKAGDHRELPTLIQLLLSGESR